jgi:hypothetical protein
MPIAASSWCISAVAIVFLVASAWWNRRTGYRRPPSRPSLLAEGWTWLEEIKDSLSEPAERTVAATLSSEPGATPSQNMPVEQLVRLGVALQTNQAAPVSAGPRAENEALVAESMDSALAQNRQ